jgi:hypothetical protein
VTEAQNAVGETAVRRSAWTGGRPGGYEVSIGASKRKGMGREARSTVGKKIRTEAACGLNSRALGVA